MFVIKFLLNRLREGFSAFSGRWQVPVVGCSVTRVPGNWSIVPGSQVCTCAACKSVDATRAWSRTGDCQCPGRRLEIFIVRRLNRVQRKCGAEADADVRDSYVPWAWWSESAGKESWHPRESWLRLVNYRCWISISIQILNKQTSTNILCRVIIFIRIKTKFLLENYVGMKNFFFSHYTVQINSSNFILLQPGKSCEKSLQQIRAHQRILTHKFRCPAII